MDVFHSKATLIALRPKTKPFVGRGRKLASLKHLSTQSQQITYFLAAITWDKRVSLEVSCIFHKLPSDALNAKPSIGNMAG